jgi:hypothetical protein
MNSLTLIVILIGCFVREHESTTYYCPDPLNVQPASPATSHSAASAGVATCSSGYTKCGVTTATGQGVCVTTATTASTDALYLTGDAETTSPAPTAITAMSNRITGCWNPATGAAAAISPALSATNQIIACSLTQTTKTGAVVLQTVGATTTASTSVTYSPANFYCFYTNCNKSAAAQISLNIFALVISTLSVLLF